MHEFARVGSMKRVRLCENGAGFSFLAQRRPPYNAISTLIVKEGVCSMFYCGSTDRIQTARQQQKKCHPDPAEREKDLLPLDFRRSRFLACGFEMTRWSIVRHTPTLKQFYDSQTNASKRRRTSKPSRRYRSTAFTLASLTVRLRAEKWRRRSSRTQSAINDSPLPRPRSSGRTQTSAPWHTSPPPPQH